MLNTVKVALIHAAVKWKDKEYNLRKLLALNEKAAACGARIIVNPELATTGYSFENKNEISPFVETIPGPTTELFGVLARQYEAYICLGLAEVDAGTGIYYNTAVLIGPDGQVVGQHRKLAPAFRENLWAARGNLPVMVAATCYGKAGVIICADAYWYKAARMAVLRGARLLLVPANWPPHHYPPEMFWRARAAENGVYVLACNRTGLDKVMNCNAARSFVIGPDGSIQNEIQSSEDAILYGTVPLQNGQFPARAAAEMMSGRRPDLYAGIALDTFSQFDPEALLGLPKAGDVTVATIQSGASAGGLKRLLVLIDRAAALAGRKGEKLNLAVLPELAAAAIKEPADVQTWAEEIPGHVTDLLAGKAGELGLYIVAGMAEKEGADFFNTAVLIGPAGLIGKYRKVHLTPSDRKWAHQGGEGFRFFDLPFGRIGLLLGVDLMFPESLECLAKQGVDILCVPARWHEQKSRFIWEARIAEQMHLVVANRWEANGFPASGGSLIYSYSRYPERRMRLLSSDGADKINIMLLNLRETRQKKFLEQVDYDLLLKSFS